MNLADIPAVAEMAGFGARFVLWRQETRAGRTTKLPMQASGKNAKSDTAATWCTLERALAALPLLRARDTRVDGLGVMLGEVRPGLWLVGADLDLALSPATDTLEPWAVAWVERLGTYGEVSPSGCGAKLFGTVTSLPAELWDVAEGRFKGKEATPPDARVPEGTAGSGHDLPELAVYPCTRFFTVTGRHLDGTPDRLADITEPFAALARHVVDLAERARKPAGKGGKPRSGAATPEATPRPTSPLAIDGRLPAKLRALLENDPKLRAAWTSGAKLGGGGDLTASGLEASLAVYLARHLGDEELREVLRLYPFGQVTKLAGGEAARRLDRLLDMAREAREQPEGFDLTHDGLALEMGREWADNARHVALWGQWLDWNGSKWERDEKLRHMTRTRDFLRAKAEELKAWAERKLAEAEALPEGRERNDALKAAEQAMEWAEGQEKQLRSAPMVAHVVGLARSNAELAAGTAQWDADPWLLGTPGGTVELRTGRLRPAQRGDFITKSAAVTPAAPGTPAPLWAAFLERTFGGDRELIGFVQRVAGYSLTGSVEEHALFFLWGQGANGKGVFLNTLTRLLDGYAAVAPVDMFLVSQADRHPTDMAMLRAARLVTAQETPPGRTWDEAKVKALTGGDPITARFMRQDFFTYEPQFTLLIAGNTKPSLRGVGEAIRRRFHLIPFNVVIPPPERDKGLAEKLRAEWPAILRWAIDGCLAWQRDGLNPPAGVQAATEDYLAGEDLLGQWIADCCEEGRTLREERDKLFKSWCEWSEQNRGPKHSSRAFYSLLSERGFEQEKSHGRRLFAGLQLRPLMPAGAEGAETPHIDRIRDAPTRAPATSDMAASGPFCPRDGAAAPAWTDDRAWIERLRAAGGGLDSRRNEILAWARAAGCGIDTSGGRLDLLVPKDLTNCPAKFALLKQARDANIAVTPLDRSPRF